MEQVIRQMGRDAQILAHLAKHGFASPKNIEDTFFSGRANRNHYRSIARLRKKGFVENLTGDHNHLLGYKPTKRGLRVAELLTKTPSLSPHRFKFRTTYDHDELLIQIRSIFESSTLVSHFQPEVVLREQLATRYGHKEVEGLGYKVPDGLFVLQTQKRNFRVALELELTRKSSCRYRKIIKQLARSRDWDIILYIVKNKHIKCVIQNLLQELREKDSDLHSENFEQYGLSRS